MPSLEPEVFEAFQSTVYWWVECARSYHDPTAFIPTLDALVQSMRHATLRLQAHKGSIPSFDAWYRPWAVPFSDHPDLEWINDARLDAVHRKGLQRTSTATVEVFHSYLGPATHTFSLSPYSTTAEIIDAVADKLPEDVLQNSFFVLTRRWSLTTRPDQEVLRLAAFGVNYLSALLVDCHRWVEDHTTSGPDGALAGEGPFSGQLLFDARSLRITVDPLTGAPYGLNRAEIDGDEQTPQQVGEHYGLDAADPLLTPGDAPDDPNDFADACEPLWRTFIQTDGSIAPVLWLRSPGGAWDMHLVQVEDRKNKYLLWREIAELVEKRGHDALLYVTEAWMVPLDSVPNIRYPSVAEAPDREEILAVYAATPNRVTTWHYPIIRTDAGASLGDRVAGDPVEPTFLTAILDVWKKRPTDQPDER